MSRAFQYKPKFVDIRVRPPREEEEDVHALKPGEHRCEHPGCLQTATAKAPKSRERMNEHYWFCQPHADVHELGLVLKRAAHAAKYVDRRISFKD